MKQILDLAKDILENGVSLPDRTGNGRRKVFGRQFRFNMRDGFPLMTTNWTPFKTMVKETLWFLTGSTSNQELNDQDVNIWNSWAVKEADIDKFLAKHVEDEEDRAALKPSFMELCLNSVGDMYGAAWRKAPMNFYNEFFPKVKEEDIEPRRLAKMKDQYELEGPTFQQTGKPVPWEQYMQVEYYSEIDQMQELINNLRKRPFSSRHIVSSWIPSFQPFEELSPEENVILGKGALAHCHAFQQYLVLPPDVEGGKPRLSLLMYQRSLDLMVGGPFNVAQYALLLHMIAQVVDMEPYEFIWTTGDSHIYLNQLESARAHVKREPLPLPKLWINPEVKDLFAFTVNDFKLEGYLAKKEDKIVYPVSK